MSETIFTGGRVFRGLRDAPGVPGGAGGGFAEALLVRDGRVAAVGTRDDVTGAAGAGARRVALDGRVVVPGLVEAHMHLLPYGLGLSQVNLRPDDGVRTLEELLRRVAAQAATLPRGAWLLGRGYDHLVLDVARHPTAEELQRAAPDNPVWVVRTCGHMGVASTAALRIAELDAAVPDPEGGAIGREAGQLTGLLQERAQVLVRGRIPVPDEAGLVAAIEAAGRDLASRGFTAATDMNVGATAGLVEIEAYRRALREGRLHQRMWQVLAADPGGIADAAWDVGLRPGREDPMLCWAAVKTFADGSAGGLTAAFREPYLPGGTGILCYDDATHREVLAHHHRRGWQLAIHAIGDAAIEQVLSAMEAADTPEAPVAGRRHRIEHCGFVDADQRARMKARGILPVPQPVFIHEFGEVYRRVLGDARAAASYPMRTWLHEGHHPSASSDSPVSSVDPFGNLDAMLSRRTVAGTVIGPDETLTVEEAVHCQTWCGAWSQFAEERRGTLEPGMLADLAVLSRDIFRQPEAVRHARAEITLRGGAVAFDRHGELGGD
ncbi:amidohydrolase [Roseomonas elaeocarpi]|uniref:Amidohydrolase n=1 Tax=Roseomonas elaeocarpi TaxID=907779 RepID=A0ABV6JQV6_9PROT